MGENQNKSDEDRFEEGLRQILSGTPSSGAQGTTGVRPRPQPRAGGGAPDTAAKAEAARKALFWFKLMRPLAFLALVALLTMFVMRITAVR